MPKKSNISVVLATFNEERSLHGCLESVKDWVDEIIIVDGSSTDGTVQIAKKFGAKITIIDNPPVFHINKQKAIDQAHSDWVLQLDADERVTPELRDELLSISSQSIFPKGDKPVAYWIKRRKMFLGRWIKKGGHYPDPVIRFFRRGKAKLPCISVHEQMEVDGKLGWLSGELIHLPTPSFSIYLIKDNRYSTLCAQELLKENPGRGVWPMFKYLFWIPLTTCFSLFIRHKGYEDGFPGFVFALYTGMTTANAYIKYWEAKETGEKEITKDWV
jgi:glycosyltransferase involved in cell wall biosynthesis